MLVAGTLITRCAFLAGPNDMAPTGIGGGRPELASDDTKAKLDEKIQSLKLKDKERELEAHAAVIGVPYFNLQGFPIGAESIGILPEEEAKSLKLVCFFFAIGDLRLGAVHPTDTAVLDRATALGKEHYTDPKLYLISEKSFEVALEAYKSVPKFKKISAGVQVTEADLAKFGDSINSLQELSEALKGVTTTEAVTAIIAGALKTRSSDVHIEAEQDGIKLRYRIDGVLYTIAELPKPMWVKMVPRLKLLSGLKINVNDRPQDGRFSISLAADSIDVRVSTLPTNFGESIVMRILRASATGVDFEKLGFTPRAHAKLVAEMEKPKGMIISTGPTGSGKTTTLYAMLNKLNDAETKIITLEDPIEYRLKGVNQSQVDPATGYTFASGLRSILRQDPDIIMVGEIRDLETADIAANAALTGHLVLSTLHTNNAAGAIPRFLGMGVKPFLLPPALNAVLGQRLVRRICEHCRIPDKIDAPTQKRIDTILKKLPADEVSELPAKMAFQKGAGCQDCQGLGFKGQIGIYEVFTMNREIEDAILAESVSERKIEAFAEAAGMVTMVQDGLIKAAKGITTISEVFRVTTEAED